VASPASGHVPPLAFEKKKIATRWNNLKQVTWFGLVLCQTLIQHYSAVFALEWYITGYNVVLARDAMHYSAVFAVVRCPSIHLSITFMHCIQTAEDIVKHLSRPGSLMILVFDSKCRYSIPREPAQNTRRKICDFRLKSPSISETIQDRPIVAMER